MPRLVLVNLSPLYYLSRRQVGEDQEMAVVYRDRRGVEYESVPLPTHEVTDAVPLDAYVVSKRVVRKPLPVYDGTDGVQLAKAPRSQRRNWTDEQWGAYEEYRQLETDQSKDDPPVASVVVVRSQREGVVDPSQKEGRKL